MSLKLLVDIQYQVLGEGLQLLIGFDRCQAPSNFHTKTLLLDEVAPLLTK